MKATVNRAELSEALGNAMLAAAKQSPRPSLNYLHVQAEGDNVTVEGVDAEAWLRRTCGMVDVQKPGSAIVTPRIVPIVNMLDDETVTLDTTDNGYLRIAASDCMFELVTAADDDYPENTPPEGEPNFTMPAADLLTAMKSAEPCMGDGTGRYAMNGMQWKAQEDGFCCTATDGRRVVRLDYDAMVREPAETLAPARLRRLLARALNQCDTADVWADGYTVTVRAGATTVGIQAVAGTFPDISRVWPEYTRPSLTVKADALRHAVIRARTFCGDDNGGVVLSVSDSHISVRASDVEKGAGTVRVPASVDADAPFTLTLSAAYLRDLLSPLASADVLMQVDPEARPSKPVLLTALDGRFGSLVMPIADRVAKAA